MHRMVLAGSAASMRPHASVAAQPILNHDGGHSEGSAAITSRLSPRVGMRGSLAAATPFASGHVCIGSHDRRGRDLSNRTSPAEVLLAVAFGAVTFPRIDATVNARRRRCGVPKSAASSCQTLIAKPIFSSERVSFSQCAEPTKGGTFSITTICGCTFLTQGRIAKLNSLRASVGSRRPSVLKPWHGGPAIITSARGADVGRATDEFRTESKTFRR